MQKAESIRARASIERSMQMSTRELSMFEIEGFGIIKLLAEGFAMRPSEGAAAKPVKRTKLADAPAPGILERIDNWFWRRHQRSLETQLAQARDLPELERM